MQDDVGRRKAYGDPMPRCYKAGRPKQSGARPAQDARRDRGRSRRPARAWGAQEFDPALGDSLYAYFALQVRHVAVSVRDPDSSGHRLVVEVLRVVRLGEKEPPLRQEPGVLQGEDEEQRAVGSPRPRATMRSNPKQSQCTGR